MHWSPTSTKVLLGPHTDFHAGFDFKPLTTTQARAQGGRPNAKRSPRSKAPEEAKIGAACDEVPSGVTAEAKPSVNAGEAEKPSVDADGDTPGDRDGQHQVAQAAEDTPACSADEPERRRKRGSASRSTKQRSTSEPGAASTGTSSDSDASAAGRSRTHKRGSKAKPTSSDATSPATEIQSKNEDPSKKEDPGQPSKARRVRSTCELCVRACILRMDLSRVTVDATTALS